MSFDRVLVANRGEIALRIIEACRELGLDSIVVYSEADRGMPYLRMAERAICIGPADPAKSYLSIPAIISAAEVTGAEAIHPGYGFLSENPDFAEVCSDHGLTFIGPDHRTIALVGDKLAARRTVAAAGVPVLPAAPVPDDEADLRAVAAEVGYPLLVKAVYGGGGRGMRLVQEEGELAAAVTSAAREATAAFGKTELYLERALINPRHIEVQVIGDAFGRIAHLGERECSIQRRHQKLIEEAPAPNLDPEIRAALHAAALTAARTLDYRSAGTVEFILDADGNFYFIEMNARIQVEHPVSEAVTGVNLVKEQIRIARGEGLSRDEFPIRGHAIECRINAEDPQTGFLPASGRLRIKSLPGGYGVRVDTHIYDGMEVRPHYDSLLAKVITWGEDREEAMIRMYTALERFQIAGVATTRDLAQEIIAHPAFREGRIGTGFLNEEGIG